MENLEVRRVHAVQTSRQGQFGGFETVTRVSFYVGGHGPFTEDFLPADFTPENVRKRLETVADTVRQLPQA